MAVALLWVYCYSVCDTGLYLTSITQSLAFLILAIGPLLYIVQESIYTTYIQWSI